MVLTDAEVAGGSEVLTWPRWLRRAAYHGLLVGLGCAMFAWGAGKDDDALSAAAVLGIGAIFAVGGFVVGLWLQVRRRFHFLNSLGALPWPVRAAIIAVAAGLGYLAGVVSAG